MAWFSTIRSRYTLAFSSLSAVFFIVVLVSYSLVNFIQHSSGRYTDGISLIQNADRDLYQSRLALTNWLSMPDVAPEVAKRWTDDIHSNARQALERMRQFQTLTADIPELVNYLAPFDGLYQQWQTETIRLLDQSAPTEALRQSQITSSEANFLQLRQLYDGAEELISKHATQERADIAAITNTFEISVTVFSAIVLLVSILLAYVAPKRISSAIRTVTAGVAELSRGDGDLTRRLNSSKSDETGDLSRELDGFISKLATLVSEVKRGCVLVQSQMQQLGDDAQTASSFSAQQDTALDLIVTAIEEMSGATRDVARNAAETVGQVQLLSSASAQGQQALALSTQRLHDLSQQVQQASEVIRALSNQSAQIASVTQVIETIAQQTTLLALNAAIEAARAGEQGRGFAVVADEVRQLASKTQASTEHIRGMIEQLQQGVAAAVASINQGVQLAENTERVNIDVNHALLQVHQVAGTIQDHSIQTASATEQQSQVAQQITENLSQLSDISKQLNAIAQRVQGAVQSTLSTSSDLAGRVKRFSV